jgi:hypothetical protein
MRRTRIAELWGTMSAAMTGESRDVRALLTFLGAVTGTPTNYFEVEPPPGTPRLYPRTRREVMVHDARPMASRLSVDREGVVLADHREGVMSDFRDDHALRSTYYPAVERLVCAVTGAARAVVFDHTHRSSAVTRRAGNGTDIAVDEAHNDYTERSGPRRVRELLAELLIGEDPDQLMRGRYAVFNVWRPINGRVEQWPLAVCDMQSMNADDFVDAELRWPHRTGHVCAVRHNPAHRWLYVPSMDIEEALVFMCYDSARRGGAVRFGAHTAFLDPASRDDARPRESIEVRTIALFPPAWSEK